MATDFNKIRQDIRSDIRPNGEGEITGQIMQDTLIEIVDAIEEGAESTTQAIERIDNDIMRIDFKLVANREEAGTQFAKVNTRIDENTQAIETLTSEIKEFPEGYYPNMSVGFADNLVGRGDVKEADFTFRASAAHYNIADDTSRVKRIKGNSVVWNQLVGKLNVTNSSGLTFSFNEDTNILTIDGVATSNWISSILSSHSDTSSHKIFLCVAKVGGAYTPIEGGTRKLWMYNGSVGGNGNAIEGTGMIYVADGHINLGVVCNVGDVFENCQIRVTKNDLTQMFTSGNEPTTVEDFYARIPSGIDINAYNEGEIIPMRTKAIRTIGFNQWDEQWVVGYLDYRDGSLIKIASGSTIASKNFIPVLPDTDYYFRPVTMPRLVFYDKDKNFIKGIVSNSNGVQHTPANCHYIRFSVSYTYGNVYKNDICINLSHSGWRNGQYAPYTPFTRELSIIKKYFPNGMRSAGNAFDSIEWDSSIQKWIAVQRVGVRTYEEGDDTNTAVITDGANTHYALAEPIVTEIEEENINFDYYVEDFGTEEALSDVPSASFRADVVYTPNAVDDIRALLKRVKNLEDSVHNIQLTQNTISN